MSNRKIVPKKRKTKRRTARERSFIDEEHLFIDEEALIPLRETLPKRLLVFPLTNLVIFPGMVLPLIAQTEPLINIIEHVKRHGRYLAFLSRKEESKGLGAELLEPDNLERWGVVGKIIKSIKLPDDSISIIVQTIKRVRAKKFYVGEGDFLGIEAEYRKDVYEKNKRVMALSKLVHKLSREMIELDPSLSSEMALASSNIDEPGRLADFVSANFSLDPKEKQELLQTLSVNKRLEMIAEILTRETELLKIGNKIQSDIRSTIDDRQKEYFLREQMKAIRRELGEAKDGKTLEIESFEKAIATSGMKQEVEKVALEELKRLSMMMPESAEYNVVRTYLHWLTTSPWSKGTKDNNNVKHAEGILNEDHHGLEEIKKRIVEFLAVRKLRPEHQGPILCFVGPPGVGKTSLGRSIARALGRKFYRFSLGGITDEAEIKGHRRTYIGALPGKVIQGLKYVKSNNPVFMFDEVDKVGRSFKGDPSSALLEVLDPEQNNAFIDHYLDVPFDLSKVMFILTANILETIPPALKDRMEVIELPGYIKEEKVQIASKFLLPRQLKEHGLKKSEVIVSKAAQKKIIKDYTHEAGVRDLERNIAKICRKVATKYAKGRRTKVKIDARQVSKYLGSEKRYDEAIDRINKPGIALGLAWTPRGGELLFIETAKMKGKSLLSLTGKLGDVISESAKISMSYVKAHSKELGIIEPFEEKDIHIHFPAGAVPKDGPSAGVTITTALISLFSGKQVRSKVAMTGELTLVGKILPVGGIKEKVIAAKEAGVKTVILPEQNRRDLKEIPPHLKKGLKFSFVKDFSEVPRLVFRSTK